jgi:hypothetical protein
MEGEGFDDLRQFIDGPKKITEWREINQLGSRDQHAHRSHWGVDPRAGALELIPCRSGPGDLNPL